MSYDTESKRDLLPDKQEFIEKSVDKDSHSRSNSREFKQTATSQNRPNIIKCRSASTSTNNDDENDRLTVLSAVLLPTSGKAETEENDDKYGAAKTIDNSRIAKETRNHSEDREESHRCFGHILARVFNPTKGSAGSEDSDSEKRSRSKKARAFSFLDTLISTSILAPLSISFWRGVWGCMDLHEELFPSWFCFTFGAGLYAIYTIFKDQFHNVYMKKWAKSSWRKRLLYRALRVLYTYTFGIACIAHWRGGWIIIDNFLFMHMWITVSLTCSLVTCLAILRSIRNLLATPLITQIDKPSCVFQFPTRYNVALTIMCAPVASLITEEPEEPLTLYSIAK